MTKEVPRETQREDFIRAVARVRKTFEVEAYEVDVRDRPDAVVQSAFIGFPGLLYELGLSPHEGQNISIKVEVDTNPPSGAVTETSIVRRHLLPNLLLLQASLAQTGMTLNDRKVSDWRSLVADRVAAMDWDRVVADVRPFLERTEDITLLTRDNVLGLLKA